MNFKKYYKEIIIVFLLALSLWLGFNQSKATFGHTDTICHSDTTIIYKPIHSIKMVDKVAYKWLKSIDTLSVHDTIINQRIDSSFQLVEIPMNEYIDSNVYVRTLGWLDSLSINNRTEYVYKTKPENFTMFLQGSIGKDVIIPSLNLSAKKVQFGLGYNLHSSSWVVNFGYRLK